MSDAPVIDELPDAPTRGEPGPLFRPKVAAFLTALIPFGNQVNAVAVWINTASATLAAAVTAALAAIDARVASAGFRGTSTTSRAIGTGSKAFVTQPGLSFAPGSLVIVADTAAPEVNYLYGNVTAYNAGTGDLTVNVLLAIGSGTKSVWTISTSGPQGPSGTSLVKAAAADLWTGTDDAKFVTSKALADAAAFTVVTGTGTVTLDFALGLNFQINLTGNTTLVVPSNMQDGDSGTIRFVQDATGGRTLALNASIKKPGGTAPTLSTAANAVDRLGYVVRGGVLELTSLEKGLA